jgi:lipoprotein-releasing system permease protein
LYNGQWIEPDTYQVVVGYELQKFSMGLLDFNKQLEILVPKPKGAINKSRKPLIKQMFSRRHLCHQ